MRIATWNVNSIRQRLDHLLTWLRDCAPDIVCLQEIKCVDEAFPREAIEALGYNVVTHGQKTFNGVALLSKYPLEEATPRLAGDEEDVHARFLEGVVSLKSGVVRVACLYLPNGNPVGTDKYPYKLKWMSRLLEYSRATAEDRRAAGAGRRFQRHSGAAGCPQSGRLGQRRAVQAADPREFSGAARPRADRRAARGVATNPANIRSGIIRPAPGRRTGASASTICCCRRRPATG